MKAICGISCEDCPGKENCRGCFETSGCPYGKQCYIAKYILVGGMDNYVAFKKKLIAEINELRPDGMEEVTELYPLSGEFVNLEYPLPSGENIKFLKEDEMYLGAQVRNIFDDDSCFGVIARESFILLCSYGVNGINPEIIIYKRRG